MKAETLDKHFGPELRRGVSIANLVHPAALTEESICNALDVARGRADPPQPPEVQPDPRDDLPIT